MENNEFIDKPIDKKLGGFMFNISKNMWYLIPSIVIYKDSMSSVFLPSKMELKAISFNFLVFSIGYSIIKVEKDEIEKRDIDIYGDDLYTDDLNET